MKGYINEDPSYFDGLDLENAKPIKHPLIEKLQANAKAMKANDNQAIHSPLDDDVSSWLIRQDSETKHHINEMIRHVMALRLANS